MEIFSTLDPEIPPVRGLAASALGSREYLRDYRVRLAYVAGAMVHGIASEALVIRMAKSGLLSFFGTGGLGLERIEAAIISIKKAAGPGAPFGMNLLCNTVRPEKEIETVGLFLRLGIRNVEASAFMAVTKSLVLFLAKGIHRMPDGTWESRHRIQAKLSRPEVARQFLSPPPPALLKALVAEGVLTDAEAQAAGEFPMAQDICVEADSGGHTDNGVAFCLLPVVQRMRDEAMARHGFANRIRVGAAGGIGTPEAVAAAFALGADFVLTGSINQCTVEAGTSELAKDMLAQAGVQDTEMAPAGDMFELGAKVQVLRKGLLFPGRANKLYDIYRACGSLEDIDADTRGQLEAKYFRRSLDEVKREARAYVASKDPEEAQRMDRNPKLMMARVFQAYFALANRAALRGSEEDRSDFQIHCGPAMGAFNQWVKGTPHEDWRNRHADEIGVLLMEQAAGILETRFAGWTGNAL